MRPAVRSGVAPGEKRLPEAAWDFIVGGAETETTAIRNRYALDSIPFVWALCGLAAARDEGYLESLGFEGATGIGVGWRWLIVIGLVVGLGGVYWAYHL